MRASRTHDDRLVPYHLAELKFDGPKALQNRIVAFVRGVRGERKTPVTEKQIVAWFRSTHSWFVSAQLSATITDGRVRICQKSLSSGRRSNGAYVYEAAT